MLIGGGGGGGEEGDVTRGGGEGRGHWQRQVVRAVRQGDLDVGRTTPTTTAATRAATGKKKKKWPRHPLLYTSIATCRRHATESPGESAGYGVWGFQGRGREGGD